MLTTGGEEFDDIEEEEEAISMKTERFRENWQLETFILL